MAFIRKSNARRSAANLIEGCLSYSHDVGPHREAQNLRLWVRSNGDDSQRTHFLQFDRKEAFYMSAWLARALTREHGFEGIRDERSAADCMRDLAGMLERGAGDKF